LATIRILFIIAADKEIGFTQINDFNREITSFYGLFAFLMLTQDRYDI
jgi:hypothetical protein